MRKNKFGNKKTWVGDQQFDSKKEAKRYGDLVLLEKAGQIKNLECQVSFEFVIGGKVLKSKAKRRVKYIADFVYEEKGERVVEDVKSVATEADRVYRIKRALMQHVNGIVIRET
jgi:ribosomal protein S8